MNKTVTTKYITENIHQKVRHDLFKNRTLRKYLEPLPRRDQPLYSPIIPYRVIIDQELDEIQIHLTPQYLPYYIDNCLIAPTSTEFIRTSLETYQETEEDIDEEWKPPTHLRPPNITTRYQLFGHIVGQIVQTKTI